MSDFARRIEQISDQVVARARAVHVGAVEAIHGSIRDGSPLTGAPGQPEATGDLKDSWQHQVEGDEGHVFTTDKAARTIEAGVRQGKPLAFRTGGAHSVKLTIAGADRLVEQVVREVVRA